MEQECKAASQLPQLQFFGLGPPVVPFYPFLGEGSPTKTDYGKKGTLILTTLLEVLVGVDQYSVRPQNHHG